MKPESLNRKELKLTNFESFGLSKSPMSLTQKNKNKAPFKSTKANFIDAQSATHRFDFKKQNNFVISPAHQDNIRGGEENIVDNSALPLGSAVPNRNP